jgi:hypothetical protein
MAILLSNIQVAPSKPNQFIRCAPHPSFALVGLRIHSIGYMATVAPIFSEVFEDGRLGRDLRNTPMITSQLGRAILLTPSMFRAGAEELHVMNGKVVTGLQTCTHSRIVAIRLEETPWDGSLRVSEARWTPWLGVPRKTGALAELRAEPRGRVVAVGIAARAGFFIDEISLVTAEMQQIAAEPLQPRAISPARGEPHVV